MVLEALRCGDAQLFESQPALDRAPIWVHFHAVEDRYDVVERWGVPGDWVFSP